MASRQAGIATRVVNVASEPRITVWRTLAPGGSCWTENEVAAGAQVHLGKRPHKCPDCDKTFGSPSDLKKHVNAVHLRMRPHKCPDCNKRFGRSDNLKKHIKAKHPE